MGLTQAELAELLSVSDRTVRRWVENPGEIPGPAGQVMIAWQKLDRRGLPWRPDAVSLSDNDEDVLDRHRDRAIKLAGLLERVDDRGGPSAPWQVDMRRGCATLGPIQVHFKALSNGGFAIVSYQRSDGERNLERDRALLEDAYACIASHWSIFARFDDIFVRHYQGGTQPTGLTSAKEQEHSIHHLLMEIRREGGGVVHLYPSDRSGLTVKGRCPLGDGTSLWIGVTNRRTAAPTDEQYLADQARIGAWLESRFGLKVVWLESA